MRPIRDWLLGLSDAVLPQTCVACDAWIAGERGMLCDDCRAVLDRSAAEPACPRCARTMPVSSIHEDSCAECRSEPFWNLSGVVRAGSYDCEPLRTLLLRLKFRGDDRLGAAAGAFLAAAVARQPWSSSIELLVPVPMHALRRWQRPRDHARELAQQVGRRLHIPVRQAAVLRVRYARSQTRLISRRARFRNVRGCFGPARRPGVAGARVCVVDNLMTSGATVLEVARVLRAAGAREVYAAVLARTVLRREQVRRLPTPDLQE